MFITDAIGENTSCSTSFKIQPSQSVNAPTMSISGGLRIADGTHLTSTSTTTSSSSDPVTGSRVLELADSIASQSLLHGLFPLPENLKSSALKRIGILDVEEFSGKELEAEEAARVGREYVEGIRDGLRDEPLLVAVLDGSTLRLFLDDEDDFAMLAENLFTELDTEDDGKLSKSEIRNALVQMGVESGVPSFSEFPMLNNILKAHGAEGDDKLGQAQFAQLLQLILQDLAAALAENHVVSLQKIKIINGSKIRKLLGDVKQLDDVIEKIYQQGSGSDSNKSRSCTEMIRSYLEEHGEVLGLSSAKDNDTAILLYDDVFAGIDSKTSVEEWEKNKVGELVTEILENFAARLDASPMFEDLDS